MPSKEIDLRGTEVEQKTAPARTDKETRRPVRGHLERAPIKHRLLRDLALGEMHQGELAEKYGCSRPAISQFKRRHTVAINSIRENLADEYAGVWVAKKLDRLRAYQDKAEQMLDGRSPRDAEVLVTILKAVAEELGDLPARAQVNVTNQSVTYQVVGIDPDVLK